MQRQTLLLAGLTVVLGLGHAAGEAHHRPPLPLNACAGDLSNIPYWTTALKAPDPRLRLRAAQNLGEARRQAAVPALTEALKDPDPHVRAEAARALERIRRAR